MQWNHNSVIYKRVVARKIRLARIFSLFRLLNKWNKQANGISGRLMSSYLVGGKQLLSSGLTLLSGDALSDGRRFNCPCELRLPYLYVPDFKHRPQKILFVEKNDWLKNRPFFMTENFLGILNRLCAEPMCKNHDFFSPWHWPLLGQYPVDVIFFSRVNVCRSVFCMFK